MRASRHVQRLLNATASSTPCCSSGTAPFAPMSCDSFEAVARCSAACSGMAGSAPSSALHSVTAAQSTPTARHNSSWNHVPVPHVAQRLRQQQQPQQRPFTALAERVAEDEPEQPQAHAPAPAQQPAPARHRQRTPALPSVEEVRARLRSDSGGGGGCSPSAAAVPQQADSAAAADGETLDWRRLVEALRRGQQAEPDAGAVLTDTFQCVLPYPSLDVCQCNPRLISAGFVGCEPPHAPHHANLPQLVHVDRVFLLQAQAHLPAHLADGAVQPAVPVLHAGGGRRPVAQRRAADIGGDLAPGA